VINHETGGIIRWSITYPEIQVRE
jgi:hypothetical protein